MRISLALPLALAVVCLLAAQVRAQPLKGKVVMVLEGDTLAIEGPTGPITLRLHGVDCPEPGQPHADQARQLTSRLALGKLASAALVGEKDPNGRARARICVRGAPPDSLRCLEEELLRAGLAWHDPLDTQRDLGKLQAQARAARRGLWADASATSPWEWRKAHPPMLKGTLVSDARGHAAIDVTHPVCLDPRARLAHWFTCNLARGLSCKLSTPAQARAAGYRLHGCLTVPPDQPPPPVFHTPAHACKRDRDCVLVEPAGPCCGCGTTWREAVHRARVDPARRAAKQCTGYCRPCTPPARRLGTRAVCVRGFCEPH
jgi:endonuclease YncB( thermonuclease family)